MERLNLQQRQNLEKNAAVGAIDDNCDKKEVLTMSTVRSIHACT